jgi:hypothetical protein
MGGMKTGSVVKTGGVITGSVKTGGVKNGRLENGRCEDGRRENGKLRGARCAKKRREREVEWAARRTSITASVFRLRRRSARPSAGVGCNVGAIRACISPKREQNCSISTSEIQAVILIK